MDSERSTDVHGRHAVDDRHLLLRLADHNALGGIRFLLHLQLGCTILILLLLLLRFETNFIVFLKSLKGYSSEEIPFSGQLQDWNHLSGTVRDLHHTGLPLRISSFRHQRALLKSSTPNRSVISFLYRERSSVIAWIPVIRVYGCRAFEIAQN